MQITKKNDISDDESISKSELSDLLVNALTRVMEPF